MRYAAAVGAFTAQQLYLFDFTASLLASLYFTPPRRRRLSSSMMLRAPAGAIRRQLLVTLLVTFMLPTSRQLLLPISQHTSRVRQSVSRDINIPRHSPQELIIMIIDDETLSLSRRLSSPHARALPSRAYRFTTTQGRAALRRRYRARRRDGRVSLGAI